MSFIIHFQFHTLFFSLFIFEFDMEEILLVWFSLVGNIIIIIGILNYNAW